MASVVVATPNATAKVEIDPPSIKAFTLACAFADALTIAFGICSVLILAFVFIITPNSRWHFQMPLTGVNEGGVNTALSS
jgi:hypothetical protein